MFMQFAIGDLHVLRRVVTFPDNRHLVTTGWQMPVEAVGDTFSVPSSNHLTETSADHRSFTFV